MNTLEQRKTEPKAQPRKEQAIAPLMNIEGVRGDLLDWLAEFRLPSGSQAQSWADLVQVFPAEPEDKEATSGVRIRLALRMATKENQYLIAIMECLARDSRGVYLLSVHVNWKPREQQIQKLVEEHYRGHFDDVLRARHTLWAQTFRDGELSEALTSSVKAILSNELVAQKLPEIDCEKLKHPQPTIARFPKAEQS